MPIFATMLKLIKRTILILGIGLLGQSGLAQNCELELVVTVKDDHTGEVLEAATITVNNRVVALTDINGIAHLTGLCAGKLVLSITHIGCEPKQVSLQVKRSGVKEIFLHHIKVELGEVTVTGNKKNGTKVKEELKGTRLFATRGLNLAQSLQDINGVRVLSTGAGISKPIISGLHSNRIVLVNNGVKLESQQWGGDHAPEIDPFAADKLTVVKGAASVRYGAEAIGGVVLAEPRLLPSLEKFSGELNLAAFSNNAMGVLSGLLEGTNAADNAFAWRVQGTFKKGGTQRIPGYWLANTALEESNAAVMLGWRMNRFNWKLSANYFSTNIGLYPGAHVENQDDLFNAIKSSGPLFPGKFTYQINRPNQQVSHYTLKLQTDIVWNTQHKTQFWVAYQENKRDEFDPRSFISRPELSLNLGTTSTELVHSIQIKEGVYWENGLHFSFQQNVNNPSSARIFVRNYQTYNPALFSIISFKSAKKWLHEAGLRYDYKWFESYYRQNNVLTLHNRSFSNVSATLGTLFTPSEKLHFNVTLATAWRPPAPNELYANGLHQGLAGVEIGNQNFNAEQSVALNVQMNWKPSGKLRLEVSGYNNYISNYIFLQPIQPPALTINGYYPRFEYRQTNANLIGTDAQLFWFPGTSIEVAAKASLLWAKDLNTKDWIILMPADRYQLGITYYFTQSRHLIKPYLQVNAVHLIQQKRVPENNADYAPPPAAYTCINLDAGAILTKSNIQMGFSVTNLTNQQYRDYLNRFRYFANETGINLAFRIKIPLSHSHHN
jgi:iron complex outermembrane recepter protein